MMQLFIGANQVIYAERWWCVIGSKTDVSHMTNKSQGLDHMLHRDCIYVPTLI